MITIPCFIKGRSEELERLMFKFGNARQKGLLDERVLYDLTDKPPATIEFE